MNSQDTVELKLVEVYSAPLDKYSFGQSLQKIDSRDLNEFQGQTLADLLQQRSGLFLRQYGAGMLASLTMRGTSAGHNAVFWNGIPINSPSLGQADFSILPVGGFDEATIHYGSSGALYGTDAIGGAIHLNNKSTFNKGHQTRVASTVGSFGRWNQLVEYGYSNGFYSSRSRVYRNTSKNNFKFRNLARAGSPEERQNNAAIEQIGAIQDLAWNIGANQQLSTSIWWNQTDRQIQPVMGSNDKDRQEDRNFRAVLDYNKFTTSAIWNIKTGVVLDQLQFNNSINKTSQFLLSSDIDWTISEKLKSKSGLRFNHVIGNLSSYEATEDRLELYQSINFLPSPSLSFSVNLRQMIFNGDFAPFTPSIGSEWTFFKNNKSTLSTHSSLSKSFKIPTLNDRFWVPGGNPDLESEESISAEIGLIHVFDNKRFFISSQINIYNMWVDNWIIWLPRGNFWSPENIREVRNQGLEYFITAKKTFNLTQLEFNGSYNWTLATILNTISENDRSEGNQLPYTPFHKAQGNLRLTHKTNTAFINGYWVGERYINTDNISSVAAYGILDIGFSKSLTFISKVKASVGFQVNNITNNDYQVLRLRAMPGRNYLINFNLSL
ncbi:TonB-dependent receptor [Belliella buryatensis]|uniref:TonB-dependent receptor n=1 Tax=Belliella buryatensis TaxID=1500549 RepID=UPI001FEBB13C|nr:TonB-dependent receptor plug domain-containing protein [Belliella buryatensis]